MNFVLGTFLVSVNSFCTYVQRDLRKHNVVYKLDTIGAIGVVEVRCGRNNAINIAVFIF